MKRSSRELSFLLAGISLLAAPFAFGLLRWLTTGTDWRYLSVAIVAFVGSSVVIGTARSQSKTSTVTVGIALIALIAATLAAVLGARFLTNTYSAASWMVALAFAFCTTVGTVLYFVSKPRGG
ncbi:MAG TPA: hypothetical protein VM053_03660 [Gemmatimonadaceae bacterium]|nr:hypothetical protein [Gemmatimonadaceae bacterium]